MTSGMYSIGSNMASGPVSMLLATQLEVSNLEPLAQSDVTIDNTDADTVAFNGMT